MSVQTTTKACGAVKHDRWRTVHTCVLERHSTGFHEDEDGFLFADADAAKLIPNLLATQAVKYDGSNRDEVGEYFELYDSPADPLASVDFVPIRIVGEHKLPQSVFPGEWALRLEDGTVSVVRSDQVPRVWRVR